ncbi:MAG TPA: DUF3302 domain-containing protein [Verrucomicrobiales bacterium]|jgi:hypothetical protein|nr:DUF3302 domain-containing protein [Verrucomicrobiales bacterium]
MDALRYTLRGAAGTRPALALMIAYWLLAVPGTARASFLHGEALDNLAEVMSWIVILIVPVIGIAVFWLVHILPEKIAEKKHHPQAKAIQCLCLLSLFFGGLLWPIAWLWAYSKPVLHKLAYGTDKEHHGGPPPGEKKEEAAAVPPPAAAPVKKEGGHA